MLLHSPDSLCQTYSSTLSSTHHTNSKCNFRKAARSHVQKGQVELVVGTTFVVAVTCMDLLHHCPQMQIEKLLGRHIASQPPPLRPSIQSL
mmetsp:Transcript_1416/g.3341  ORF Transcript_1416/g.3341 Transcript_1416/m.3341 type:complete len:91 (+) Transcript_1416:1893-2165(+)